MPSNSNWIQLYGVGVITGIGFTMSLFVGNLAFVDNLNIMDGVKIGVLSGSFLSAVVGYFMLLIISKTFDKNKVGLVFLTIPVIITATAIQADCPISAVTPIKKS